MKSRLWIGIGASAIVNIALVVGDPRADSGNAPGTYTSEKAARGTVIVAVDGETQGATGRTRDGAVAVAQAVESGDLATYRDKLRAAGFPDWAVAALIERRIATHFSEVRRQRLGPTVVEPFWKSPDPAREQERRLVNRQISREQAAMRRELLGAGQGLVEKFQANRMAFLPPDKAELIGRIEADYSELTGDLHMERGGRMLLEEDREKLAMIEREKRADLVAALTPQELEAYDLRFSRSAQSVRSRMRNFDPTEEEFLSVYALQKIFDERFPQTMSAMPRSQEEMKARRDADTELRAQIKNVLGEARYTEYERSSNPGFQAAQKIVEHFNLPRENAASVYALQDEVLRRQNDAMRGSQSQAARNEAMTALAAEASARVAALLGEEGAKAFRESGGSWLRNLEQQAQRLATSPPAPTPRP